MTPDKATLDQIEAIHAEMRARVSRRIDWKEEERIWRLAERFVRRHVNRALASEWPRDAYAHLKTIEAAIDSFRFYMGLREKGVRRVTRNGDRLSVSLY